VRSEDGNGGEGCDDDDDDNDDRRLQEVETIGRGWI